jgi:hypothetical protein
VDNESQRKPSIITSLLHGLREFLLLAIQVMLCLFGGTVSAVRPFASVHKRISIISSFPSSAYAIYPAMVLTPGNPAPVSVQLPNRVTDRIRDQPRFPILENRNRNKADPPMLMNPCTVDFSIFSDPQITGRCQ